MDQLQAPKLVPIRAVPGLFISDRFGARSTQNLKEHNIVRILSVLQPHETWRIRHPLLAEASAETDGVSEVTGIEAKTIDVDDDPFVDILQYLGEACDWIEAGLSHGRCPEEQDAGKQFQPGVLVHCKQGISRSGAFIVAFLMRKFKLSYSAAVTLARESRTEICPNSGFEKQLRVWEFCQYNVYLDDDDDHHHQAVKQKASCDKPSYKAWKAERDSFLKRGEADVNRARFSSLANMAARFGLKRQEEVEVADDQAKGTSEGNVKKSIQQNQRKESWERVQKMEQSWNERLIRGQIHGDSGDTRGLEE